MNNLSDDDKRNNLEKEYRSEKEVHHENVKDNLFATILHDYVRERSANRRWSMIKWILISSLLFLTFLSLFLGGDQKYPISAEVSEHTAVLKPNRYRGKRWRYKCACGQQNIKNSF